jgi:hypothetical protein
MRPQFTIRSLMAAVAATALLFAGGIFLLELFRKPGPSAQPRQPPMRKSYIIMEGVDINSNGRGPVPQGSPASDRRSSRSRTL